MNTLSSDVDGKPQEYGRDDIAAAAVPSIWVEDLVTAPDKQDVEAQDLQEQVEEHEKSKSVKFGTFGGVRSRFGLTQDRSGLVTQDEPTEPVRGHFELCCSGVRVL